MNLSEKIFRISFIILNLIIVVGGLILVIVGAILVSISSMLLTALNDIRVTRSFDYTVFLNSAIILIVVGIILILIACVGIIGTIKHKIFAFLLMAYLVVMVSIILLQIAGVILAFFYQSQIVEAIRNDIGPQVLSFYQNDTGIRNAVDFIQDSLSCCGFNDTYRDYTSLNILIPTSCSCVVSQTQPCVNIASIVPNSNVTSVYPNNCVTAAQNILNNRTYQYILGGIGIAFLVFEISLVLFAICLIYMDFKGDDD